MKRRLLSKLLVPCFLVGVASSKGEVIYVKHDASGSNNGTSWANAFTNLQSAISAVDDADDEIWVATGTYKPAGPGGSRSAAFVLFNSEELDIKLYGGFVGNESQLSDRDWFANETILSGDLNGNDPSYTDNSYHVVHADGAGETAFVDGFTITGGHADASGDNAHGGGVFLKYSNATIRNCWIKDNFASELGGGASFISCSSPTDGSLV